MNPPSSQPWRSLPPSRPGLPVPQGSRVPPGVAAPPPRQSRGGTKGGGGAGVNGAAARHRGDGSGGPLKGPRHRGTRPQGTWPRRSGGCTPTPGVWGGLTALRLPVLEGGLPQLSCAPHPPRVSCLCHLMCASTCMAPPKLLCPRCHPTGVVSPHGCSVFSPTATGHPPASPTALWPCAINGGGSAQLQWRC